MKNGKREGRKRGVEIEKMANLGSLRETKQRKDGGGKEENFKMDDLVQVQVAVGSRGSWVFIGHKAEALTCCPFAL